MHYICPMFLLNINFISTYYVLSVKSKSPINQAITLAITQWLRPIFSYVRGIEGANCVSEGQKFQNLPKMADFCIFPSDGEGASGWTASDLGKCRIPLFVLPLPLHLPLCAYYHVSPTIHAYYFMCISFLNSSSKRHYTCVVHIMYSNRHDRNIFSPYFRANYWKFLFYITCKKSVLL